MERSVGSTDLRQRLTDILQRVRERREAYVIETFGRPQAAIINLEDLRLLQELKEQQAEYTLRETLAQIRARGRAADPEELQALIEEARADFHRQRPVRLASGVSKAQP